MKLPVCFHSKKGRQITALLLGTILLICLVGWVLHANVVPALTEITQMVVSRGLGNSSFPLRLGNRPEVVLAVLRQP